MWRWIALLSLAGCAQAQIVVPDELVATMRTLRGQAGKRVESRDAYELLTVAKHELRARIEAQLSTFHADGDAAVLAHDLNEALKGLMCTWGDSCPQGTWIGYLARVRLQRLGLDLVVETSLGIQCGFDDSAYLFSWRDGKWALRWESEQNDYSAERYKPQNLSTVQVGGSDGGDGQLVLTLGTQPWCSSNWRGIYARVWRLRAGVAPQLILDESDYGFAEGELVGSVGVGTILMEYSVGTLDKGVLIRRTSRAFRVQGDRVERVAPLALSPRDFLDEWLTRDWKVAAGWSGQELAGVHRRFHSDSPNGEFVGDTMHCAKNPDLWQVGVDMDEKQRKLQRIYFLVRWRPPYRFEMVKAGTRPFAGCTTPDPEADAPHTLFPGR